MGVILLGVKRLWLLAVALGLLTVGCVFDAADPFLPDDPEVVPDPGDPAEGMDDPCLCDSDACFEQWIRESGHCGECVVFACDYGDVHACAQCPGDFDPAPRPKGPKQDLQGGMGVDTQRPL